MQKIIFSLSFFLTVLCSWAQKPDRCGTVKYLEYKYQQHPELKNQHQHLEDSIRQELLSRPQFRTSGPSAQESTLPVIKIPVVVHIIHNNANQSIGGANIPDSRVYEQIQVLNEDFRRLNVDTVNTPSIFDPVAADARIEFCLASRDPEGNATTGITRHYTTRSGFSYNQDLIIKSFGYWPSDQYLNIWVCNLTDVLGFASFPGGQGMSGLSFEDEEEKTDGVVIGHPYFGLTSDPYYDLGRTTTHEVGHWLGLRHIWGDDDGLCADDYVSDTPMADYPSINNTSCSPMANVCDVPPVMFQNYMDYSPDVCMNLYTAGQRDRMHAVINLSPRRKLLLESGGCCGSGNKRLLPIAEDFEDADFQGEGWSIFNADQASPYTQAFAISSPSAYGEGSYSLRIKNDSLFQQGNKYYDYFTSPFLDFNTAENPVLTFDMAYARNTSSSQTDSLVVTYDITCDSAFALAESFYGNSLVTTSRTEDNFSPQPGDWKNFKIALSGLAGKGIGHIRFENYSKGKNILYLDNINIYKTNPSLKITVFPSPARYNAYIEVIYNDYRDVTVEIYNVIGQKFYEKTVTHQPAYTTNLQIPGLADGIYIARVIAGDERKSIRFIVDENQQ